MFTLPPNFEFAYPWVVYLVPVPLLFIILLPKSRTKSSALFFPKFLQVLDATNKKGKNRAKTNQRNIFTWLYLIFTYLLLLLALAHPQLIGKPKIKVKTSRNFLIVADISFSMAHKDWTIGGKKVTRWEAVKSVMNDFIKKREGDRMGLIFFGTNAYIQAPFTPDLPIIDQMLDEADVGMAGQMTHIGKAITKGVELFENDTIKSKVMLLLTDGVDAGDDILPLDAADLAQRDSIHVYTIGIGDPEQSSSDLDEKTLQQIAEITDAKYFLGKNTEELNTIYDELNKLEPMEFEEESYKPKTVLYYYPLGVAVGLTLLYCFLAGLIQFGRKIFSKS